MLIDEEEAVPVSVSVPVPVLVLVLCVASARRLATPQTIPVASRGRFRKSNIIGTRISSFDPRSRLLSSSLPNPEAESSLEKNRGSSLFSNKSEAAGSAAVRVSDRKRGLSTIKDVVRASRRIEIELAVLV